MIEHYHHKEHPKTVGRREFWKQIKRTVNGKEVSKNDILAITAAVKKGLLFDKNDNLLDLGCGNAALASYFLNSINLYHGVDFSEYLLEIAQEYFHVAGKTSFQNLDLNESPLSIAKIEHSNKVLIYGAFSYLTVSTVQRLSDYLTSQTQIERMFIGNIPNIKKAKAFYAKRNISQYELLNHKSAIGIWWEPNDLASIFQKNQCSTKISKMPTNFYASEYRFDLIVSR